jgi:hypothetical protein
MRRGRPRLVNATGVVRDRDGNRLRLYLLETHRPELKPDEDNLGIRSWADT